MARSILITCIDCLTAGVQTFRKTPHLGPRCATHHKLKLFKQRQRARELRLMHGYTLTLEDYEAIKAAQGGTCAVWKCRANGTAKALAVDHDHDCEASHGGVIRQCCIRALLCGPHNEWLGKAGNDPLVFFSLAEILTDPPAQKVLRLRGQMLNGPY